MATHQRLGSDVGKGRRQGTAKRRKTPSVFVLLHRLDDGLLRMIVSQARTPEVHATAARLHAVRRLLGDPTV